MSENLNDPGHGDSVAAWTTVITIMVASALGTWGVWIWNDGQPEFGKALVIVSVVLIPVAFIAGLVLRGAGYGVNGAKSKH